METEDREPLLKSRKSVNETGNHTPEVDKDVVDDTAGTSVKAPYLSCGCSYVVEPAIILYAVAGFPMTPLSRQYTYAKMAEQLGSNYSNLSTNNHHDVPCVGNNTDELSDRRNYLQQQVALFDTYKGFAGLLPVAIMLAFYGAYSDRFGRKMIMIIPSIGIIANALVYMATMYFDLSIYTLILTSLISAIGGSESLMVLASFAYIADICPPEQRAFRMAVLDVLLLLFAALAELGTGYWIEYMGFFWPFLFIIGGKIVTLIYVILFIPQTIPEHHKDKPKKTICSLFTQTILLYTRVGTVKRRRLRLALLTFSYLIVRLAHSSTIRDYFSMNAPLCWDSIQIGYYHAVYYTIITAGTLLGAKFFARCINTERIILVGVASGFIEYVYYGFVTSTLMMYFAPALGVFHLLPTPLTRSLMSSLVDGEEQGAMLAAVMIVGSVAENLSAAFMNPIYSASLSFMPGLVFLVTASTYALSAAAMIIYIRISDSKKTPQIVDGDISPAINDTTGRRQRQKIQ